MNLQPLFSLCRECVDALSLLSSMADRGHAGALSELSECQRRACSTLADLHAELFFVFIPPLPRSEMGHLGETLRDVTGAVFAAASIVRHAPSCLSQRKEELQGLCRMGGLIEEAVSTLPRFVRGKQPPAPDTFRFYAEQNKVRAIHGIRVLHAERTLLDRALNERLCDINDALSRAHQALLSLMLQSI